MMRRRTTTALIDHVLVAQSSAISRSTFFAASFLNTFRCSRHYSATIPPPPPPPPVSAQSTSAHKQPRPSNPYIPASGKFSRADPTAQPSSGTGGPKVQVKPREQPTKLFGRDELIQVLIEHIPTFFVTIENVGEVLPPDLRDLVGGRDKFTQLVRKNRGVFECKFNGNGYDIRIQPAYFHSKKGAADDKYNKHSITASDLRSNTPKIKRITARSVDPGTIAGRLYALTSDEFVSIESIQANLPEEVIAHKGYDPVMGVAGLVSKYPEVFQIKDGMVRHRPGDQAPNSIDALGKEDSPMPSVYRKVVRYVPTDDAMIETSALFALLAPAEKGEIKAKFKSFPRFLRMHGREITVSQDNLKVQRFFPEKAPEEDSGSTADIDELLADDPTNPLPQGGPADGKMTVPYALRDLFDAMPLMQAIALEDALMLVPKPAKETLLSLGEGGATGGNSDASPPPPLAAIAAQLENHPTYFVHWRYPDDPRVIMIMRGKLRTPSFTHAEIAEMVSPFVPQGGVKEERLFRKLPLPLQRYLHKYGMRTKLKEMTAHFLLASGRVMKTAADPDDESAKDLEQQ